MTNIPISDLEKLTACAKREGTEGAIARAVLVVLNTQAMKAYTEGAVAKAAPEPAVVAPVSPAQGCFEEEQARDLLQHARIQAIIQKAKDAVASRSVPPSAWTTVKRPKEYINPQLHELLCSLIGAPLEQFLKYDPARNVVDYSANMAHLTIVVDLIDFMAIPGSGFEYAWYYSRSAPAVRLHKAKKALAGAIEEMHLLGGPGVAPDSIVQAFYEAKEEAAAAEAALIKYTPDTVPVDMEKGAK